MGLNELIKFDEFITRDLMSIIYMLGAVGITIVGIGAILRDLAGSADATGTGFLAGVLILTVGNLMWRILCEALVVMFRINDSLISMDGKMKKAE